MFKKKRNALIEEMRGIVRDEVPEVLHELGLVTPRVTVFTQNGVKTSYVAKPVEDRAARALAEQAKVVALEALDLADSARVDAAQAPDVAGGTRTEPTFDEEVDRQRRVWDEFEAEVTESVLRKIGLDGGDKVHKCDLRAHEDLVPKRLCGDVVVPTSPIKVVVGTEFFFGFGYGLDDRVKLVCGQHYVSPLRSGLCGGAQSSPTLTVAETGCACQGAASGAGVSSAAPASQTSEGGAA